MAVPEIGAAGGHHAVLVGEGDRLQLGVDPSLTRTLCTWVRTVWSDRKRSWAMRRLDQPLASSPRISRSRPGSVPIRSSMVGSWLGRGGLVASIMARWPLTTVRRAFVTCRLERSLASQPSAPQAVTAAMVALLASPASSSTLVAGEAT